MQDATLTAPARISYLEQIRHFPMLKAEEEYTLAARWRECGDRSAANQLVTSHLRLVVKIAMGYRRCGLPICDLISEGNIGLMEAIRRFDPNKGVRFSTYAMWWIKAAIQGYTLRSRSLVRMGTTYSQKKLFFKLSKTKRRFSATQDGDLYASQVTLIATELGVAEKDVSEMNGRLSGDMSLNVHLNEDDDSAEWQDRLVDESADQESALAEWEETEMRRQALSQALMLLDDRERQIFEARRLSDPPLTLDELATKFRISCERVRQIEVRALQRVQRAARLASARMRNLGQMLGLMGRHDGAPRSHELPMSTSN
jgi:RNA polymerase sigma-32 factor